MLENRGNRTGFQNSILNSFRKSWLKLLGSFFPDTSKVQGRLSVLGEGQVSGRVDEEVPENFQPPDIQVIEEIMMEKVQKTREEVFAEAHFEWIKTERQGDVSKFKEFLYENGVEYTVFQDNSRVRTELIGDVVLLHQHPSEILGGETMIVQPSNDTVLNHMRMETLPISQPVHHVQPAVQSNIDPVIAILDKTKKRTEKVTLTLTLKIPAPDLYNVIKENFENTDEILLNSIMEQIHDNLLRDALRKELQGIYQKRKRNQ